MINAKYEAKVEKPADPKKQGYQFAGWYKEEDLKTAYQFPDKMPAKDVSIYAKWTANKNTPYRVEYYGENVRSGQYELMAKSAFKGTTDSYVTPEPWAMPGYDSDVIMAAGAFVQGSSIELSADGPIKPPYAVYFQGGLTWYHAKLGILMSLQKLYEQKLVNEDMMC